MIKTSVGGSTRLTDPKKAAEILSDEERRCVVTLHNGWPGFLYPFILPAEYESRVFGMNKFSRSGSPKDVYGDFGFHAEGLRAKILSSLPALGR